MNTSVSKFININKRYIAIANKVVNTDNKSEKKSVTDDEAINTNKKP